MGKLIYVTGGARSGKSTFAEKKVNELSNEIIYVATAIAFDDEMKFRIDLHKKQRPSSWYTIEVYKNIIDRLKQYNKNYDGVLLDCITLMVNNIMMDELEDWDNIKAEDTVNIEKRVIEEVNSIIEYTKMNDITFVIVTNEIGSGIVPIYSSTRLYRDIVGRANQLLAQAADEAYLLVSSLPISLK